ncbi:MAG: hypothetical protein U0325_03345 [Polyangiales bacterium]
MRPIIELSAALGFAHTGGIFARAEGRIGRFAVSLEERAQRGNEDDLLIAAALPYPTDLGLQLTQGGTFMFASRGRAPTGHAGFDGVIDVAANDPDAARALLTDAARGALLEMVGVGRPWVTDHAVGFTCSTVNLQPEESMRHVRRVVTVAAEMERAASRLQPTAAMQRGGVADALRRVAEARGMSLRGNALCVEGETLQHQLGLRLRAVDGVELGLASVDAWRERAGLRLRLTFRERLGVGLTMRPAGAMDRVWEALGRGDLHVDDPDFDRAWTLSATDVTRAQAVLHDGARAALTQLSAWGLRFSLDDGGLQGEAPLPDSGEAVTALFWILDGLRDQLRPRASRGAYR